MCGKKQSAPAPPPIPIPDASIANRGSSAATGVDVTKRVAGTDDAMSGLGGSSAPAAGGPVTKSVLGG